MENYGLAMMDASSAIKLDKTFPKAYYRRGSAYFALAHLNEAVKDFKRLCKLCPKDKDARQKYTVALKMKREKDFAMSIAVEEKKIELNPDDFREDPNYEGPKIASVEDIDSEWCVSLMNWLKNGKQLHGKYLAMILNFVRDYYIEKPSLVDLKVPDDEEITVCGDVHGQYYDLLNIFELNGNPSETNPYLFNGDIVDRGSWGVEIAVLLFAWKCAFPEHMHVNRGNHETKNMNKMYGFEPECNKKYNGNKNVYEFFADLFTKLPISTCLNEQVLVQHGGLYAKDGVTLDDIRKTDRFREPGDSGILCETLWSDPCDMEGRHPSK